MNCLPGEPEQTLESRGIPVRALAWSIGLHALAISLLVPHGENGARALPPVRVLHGQLLSAAPEMPVKPATVAAPVRSRQKAIAPLVAPLVSPAVLPAPTFSASTATPANDPGGIPVVHEAAASATVAMATDIRDSGPDAAGLRQYRLALAGEARRYKRYPEVARRSGLAGTAEVRVAVESVGSERLTELTRSSGHALLDAAALEMMRLAAARTSLPESLRGQRFAVLLPVVFEVND